MDKKGKYMVLNDDQLNNAYGGMTNAEIVNKIYEFYDALPADITNAIIEVLQKYGKTTAKTLAQKLLENRFDWAMTMLQLFD